MLNDLVPTRPERDDLFDPGLCGIQIRRSLQPNSGPLILSSEDIVPGRFHGSSVNLRDSWNLAMRGLGTPLMRVPGGAQLTYVIKSQVTDS